MNNLWETKTTSLKAMETELKKETVVINDEFELIDEIIGLFHLQSRNSQFCAVAGLALIKARNLALGIFSLQLDGLAQEAGALLRPLIECEELLEYFRLYPEGIKQAIDGKLPSAGKRAELTKGTLQGLRNHLNINASHISLQPQSMKHLADFNSGDWKVSQPYNKTVLRTNMFSLFLFLSHLSYTGANCLVTYDFPIPPQLGIKLSKTKENGLITFTDLAPANNQNISNYK